jgi:predicted PurR-regulated permease PerM
MAIFKKQYFFVALLILALLFGAILLWPFIKIIILAIALTVVLSPIYRFCNKATRNTKWLSALITVLFFLVVLCVPIFTIGLAVFHESQDVYHSLVANHNVSSVITKVNTSINGFLPEGASVNLEERIAALSGQLTSVVGSIFTATVSTLFSLILVILSLFYFLKDGGEWRKRLVELSPLSEAGDNKILTELERAINGVMKGYLLIGAIQGLLMGVGLFIFGVPNAALWGVLAAISSLVPSVGTTIISVPAILFLFATGHSGAAIGFMFWALILVGLVDNLLNPIIVGRKVKIHPILILFAVLGGITLMGPIGILIGPLVISFIHALISVYWSEIKTGD